MTTLVLVRHGEAAAPKRDQPDRNRELTPEGRADILGLAQYLVPRASSLETIIHSPYRRAQQTAEILARTLEKPTLTLEQLVPGGSVEAVLDHISDLGNHLMLVSHLPFIGKIAATLAGRNISFYEGSCLALQRQDTWSRSAKIDWLRHPQRET